MPQGITTGGNAYADITSLSTSYGSGWFGDGIDGDVTISNTVTLTKEMYYKNLTITSTGTLKPAGFRIFVSGTLTIASGGSINDDGNAPNVGVGGLVLNARQTLGFAGGAGGNGGTAGVGAAGGGPGGNSSLNAAGLAPVGGAGGAGGINAGGIAGSAAQPVQLQRWNGTAWQQQGRFNNGTAQGLFNGGAGGGGGGSNNNSALGGGGGGGAGGVWLAARYIFNSGRISANGANGANGSGTLGDAGGGGGGAGGLVCVGTQTGLASDLGVIQTLGGLGGTGYNAGATGGNGQQGSTLVVVLG